MELNRRAHLAYCTNIHRGQTWLQTLDSLEKYALAVRRHVCPGRPFAIGLRLGHRAALELAEKSTLRDFQRWLAKYDCYIFTINGFPYGRFHGAPVKHNVYLPDWSSPDRLAYTRLLFDLLARLLPEGVEGSVSTLPGSFKSFVNLPEHEKAIRDNLWRCVGHISRLRKKTRKILHLGLEPEPLCLLENSAETIAFFERLRADCPRDGCLDECLGVNYDCCHFAVEFEKAAKALAGFQDAGIKLSKIHLSSALKIKPSPKARAALKKFHDDVYLHQVIERTRGGKLNFYRDLPDALAGRSKSKNRNPNASEWRIHFHVPLHAPAIAPFQNTNEHLLDTLDWLAANPRACSHLEMETYTWEVLPPELKSRTVVEQLGAEYEWTLARLAERGLY